MHKVPEYKKQIVAQLVRNIESYPITGVVNMENLPAPQLQRMREKLRGKVLIFMTKKRIMHLAFEKAKEKKLGIELLEAHFGGMPALIFTRENPFALFKSLKESKSNAPAKPGQVAPKDIVIQAGPTGFAPGPVIGELAALGVKTQVDAGKISIRETTVVCREGKQISDKLAAMLTRLGIEPVEVGLDLVVTYEDGIIFTKKVLDIDEKQFLADLVAAHREAIGLSLEVGYTSKDTIKLLVQRAFRFGKTLAVERKIICSETVKDMLEKAALESKSIKTATKMEADESMPSMADIRDKVQMDEVEDLAKRLVRKGTLR